MEACVDLARRFHRNPEDVVDWWRERAAIREFEGGQTRDEAERDELADVEALLGGDGLVRGDRRSAQQSATRDANAVPRRKRE